MPTRDQFDAAELLRRWRQIVNGNNAAGRDGALLKNYLQRYSGIQILLGMYRYRGKPTISIPQFLSDIDEWLEPNEDYAAIELACELSHMTPPEYYIWQDMQREENAHAVQMGKSAYAKLLTWAEGVLR